MDLLFSITFNFLHTDAEELCT